MTAKDQAKPGSSGSAQQIQRVELQLPKAHCPKQQLIMEAFLHPGIREIWVPCGTKFGKTLSASVALANGAMRDDKRGAIWRWLAPIYEQSKIGYAYMKKMLPPPPYIDPKPGKMEIELLTQEALIRFFHTQDPESLEGYGIAGYVFDEAAKMKELAYSASRTTTTMTRAPMLFTSTPRGKNWFYKKCMDAKHEMLAARAEGRQPTKILIRAKTADNPFVPRLSIEEARKELPARLFRQYYEAEFEDDGVVFSGFRQCMDGFVLALQGEHHRWFHSSAKDCEVVIGADWAKTVDWTVFFAIDIKTSRIVGLERFHKRPYTEAIRNLVRFSREFKETAVVYHDKTGVGAAIDDQLAYTDLPFEGITFTNAWKNENVSRLMTTFEQQGVILPHWPILETELDGYEVHVTEAGNMTYGGGEGIHDDTVSALLLAHAALLQYGERDLEVRFAEAMLDDDGKPQQEPLSDLERFYQDISENDE